MGLYPSDSLVEARAVIEEWLEEYNAIRPHPVFRRQVFPRTARLEDVQNPVRCGSVVVAGAAPFALFLGHERHQQRPLVIGRIVSCQLMLPF